MFDPELLARLLAVMGKHMRSLCARRIFPAALYGCFLSVACMWAGCLPASAASPFAVIKSERNAATYQDQHLGTFEEDWKAFQQTLDAANVRYDLIGDADLVAGPARLAGYKLIMVPLLVDLPAEAVFSLTEYLKAGGRLIVTDGGGVPAQSAQAMLSLAGVAVKSHLTMTDDKVLVWERQPLPVQQEFSVGTAYAQVETTNGGNVMARWQDAEHPDLGPAMVRRNGNIYMSWAPGMQGEITANAGLISSAMEELVPGITQLAAVQISFAEYQSISGEMDYLARRTDEAIKTARQADLAVPFKIIQQNYEQAMSHVRSFHEAYKSRQYLRADEELQRARRDFSLAFAQSMPVRPVEARSIWLDRGTIVATRNQAGMSDLFDRLKKAGINTVYFETNNAGFTMFPTEVGTPNPECATWDPLGVAVREARKRGMELHAWVWIFAVGNIRHNPIIGRDPDYPGPVLAKYDPAWALAGANGAFLPKNQPEFWLDPANPDARKYVKDLILEIVKKYPVDGVQLDYIRYPFNNRGSEMGFDWAGRTLFERETGLSLDRLDDQTRLVWQAWKVAQVNEFVRDISATLKRMKSGFRLSAAVYAIPKRLRLAQIQQEWETWVANGWVDTLNPMTYVTTPDDLSRRAGEVRESTLDKALVYPGLSIRQLDTAGLIEQLDSSRAIGTLGTTLFAVAQLDDAKLNLLKVGPYRKQALLTPQSAPIRASRLLVDDFASMVNRYLQDPQKHILSDQASTNEVLSQIMAIQRDLHRLSEDAKPADVDAIASQVAALHANIREWLRLEAFVQRGFRAQYIANYLNQVQAILQYASHRARSEEQLLAGFVGVSK